MTGGHEPAFWWAVAGIVTVGLLWVITYGSWLFWTDPWGGDDGF